MIPLAAIDVRNWLDGAVKNHHDQGLSIIPGLQDEFFWPVRGTNRREVIIQSVLPGKRSRIAVISTFPHKRQVEGLNKGLDKALAQLLDLPVVDQLPEHMTDEQFRTLLVTKYGEEALVS